jgi:hypothetical protein
MNSLLLFLLCLPLILAAGLMAIIALRRGGPGQVTYGANIAEGTHEDGLTGYADAAITTRHLLYKRGVAANTFAVAGADDVILGTIADEVATADIAAVPVTLQLLGKGSTKRMVASEAMATTGVPVFAAASGKIALAGARQVGVLLTTAAADGDVVEVQDLLPTSAGAEVVITTKTITAAESGSVFFLSLAGGFTATLPAVALGLHYTFVVKTAPTTAYIIASATADNIIGYPVAAVGTDESANGNTAGDQINFVANVALPGDSVEVWSDGTSWFAKASGKATGAITITG